MIITVTLNPSIDKTLRCDGAKPQTVFKAGSINTVSVVKVAPGGKGINVSRAVKRLGDSTIALSIIGGETGRQIISGLEAEDIPLKYVPINGESRMCYGIINGDETVINEAGPLVIGDVEGQFMELFRENVHNNDIVVISGSAIIGIAPEFYGRLVTTARNLGAKVMVDLKGDNLKYAISAQPDIIKVNRTELEGYFGYSINQQSDLYNMAKELLSKGVESVIVTDGGGDVIGCNDNNSWILTPPKVTVVNSWGSGDCVAGGFAFGLSIGKTFIEALRLGVACGTTNTLVYGAGFINNEDVHRLIDEVIVKGNII